MWSGGSHGKPAQWIGMVMWTKSHTHRLLKTLSHPQVKSLVDTKGYNDGGGRGCLDMGAVLSDTQFKKRPQHISINR